MCLSIPMQVVALDPANPESAIVERRQGDRLRRETVNMMLIGAQPIGTWILAALGLAREVIDDAERSLIEDALAALSSSLAGDYDAANHFSDLERLPAASDA